MSWEFDNKLPIFRQIVDTLIVRIIKGDYKPGDKLDSVRDLAVEAGVNPNTVQRALVEIEQTGLLETRRGDGRYVTDNTEVILRVKQEYIEKNAVEFLTKMSGFGLQKDEIVSIIAKMTV